MFVREARLIYTPGLASRPGLFGWRLEHRDGKVLDST